MSDDVICRIYKKVFLTEEGGGIIYVLEGPTNASPKEFSSLEELIKIVQDKIFYYAGGPCGRTEVFFSPEQDMIIWYDYSCEACLPLDEVERSLLRETILKAAKQKALK